MISTKLDDGQVPQKNMCWKPASVRGHLEGENSVANQGRRHTFPWCMFFLITYWRQSHLEFQIYANLSSARFNKSPMQNGV